MALEAGSKLGPYEIAELIGKGGMGEVYRARDPRLNRDVAIKVSAQEFSERFEREAKVVASLNHPNICHLYDVGPNYLVMELVEGEAPKGPMTLEEAMPIARQIVQALEAAHEAGVIHRDLKPANIKVRRDGTVKVLDFGLAKVASGEARGSDATVTLGATQPGAVLGTPAYMAPEQVRGKDVNKRADIWAFGVVLFELLTGERLFKGEDLTDTLATVVKIEPDLSRAPREVQRLLKRCLEKDPGKRLRDIGDVWELLESGTEVPLRAEARPPRAAWVAAGVFAAAAVALAVLYFQPGEPAPLIKTTALLPEGAILAGNIPPAISPDGRRIAFAATNDGTRAVWVRDLETLEARMLPGTESPVRIFWAPDSRWLAFATSSGVKRIDVTGGPALPVTDALTGGGGSWGTSGLMVLSSRPGSGIDRINSTGGAVTKVVNAPLSRAPWFLPDGRHFLYTGNSTEDAEMALYVADAQASEEENLRAPKRLFYTESNAVYADPGYILFVRDRTLMAQPFDAVKLEIKGDAVPAIEQVDYSAQPTPGQFSASRNGVLVYTSGGAGGKTQLTWFDRTGKNLGTIGPAGELGWATISPDGSTVAFDRRTAGNADIWLYDLARGAESRFTFGPKGNNLYPIWSPDGTRIAFFSTRTGNADIYQRALAGNAQDEVVDDDALVKRPSDWNGKYMIEEAGAATATVNDVWMVSTDDNKPVPVLQSSFAESEARLSPDGKWLAYRSNESGQSEVYVVSFPATTVKTKISTHGGIVPVWSRDGRELYFVAADRKLNAVKVRTVGEKLVAGVPEPLFEISLTPGGRYDVSKDGRFLVPAQIEAEAAVPLTIVQNWTAGLK